MTISINNTSHETNAVDVAALAAELQLPERGVALAIDNVIVPRTQWVTTTLTADCHVTVIKAAFGG